MAYTLILSSGGIESTVASYTTHGNNEPTRLIHFDIGHSGGRQEAAATEKTSIALGMPLKKVSFPDLQGMFSGIMDEEALADEGDTRCNFEVSFLPGLIELSILYGRQSGARQLVIGLTKEQMGDGQQKMAAIKKLAEANQEYNPEMPSLEVLFPFSELTKPEVIAQGARVNADLASAWSCFKGFYQHCGTCASCRER